MRKQLNFDRLRTVGIALMTFVLLLGTRYAVKHVADEKHAKTTTRWDATEPSVFHLDEDGDEGQDEQQQEVFVASRKGILRNTAGSVSEMSRRDTAVLLRNALIDTAADLDALNIPPHLRSVGSPGAYIVQFADGLKPGDDDQIRDRGGAIVSYIPNNALLVQMNDTVRNQIEALPAVSATLAFEPYYKLSPSLLGRALRKEPLARDQHLTVLAYPGQDGRLIDRFQEVGAEVSERQASPFGEVLTVNPGQLAVWEIAGFPEVQGIEPKFERRVANDRTRVTLGVATNGLEDTETYLGLTGSNIWININDTGVDAEHPDLVGRVVGDTDFVTRDRSGHGTHVAGIMAGSGEQSSELMTNAPGSEAEANFKGMAPNAKLLALSVDLQTGPGVSDGYLVETAAETNYVTLEREHPMVSNNSWAYVGAFEYSIASSIYDAAVRDALPERPGQQPLIYVFATGNEGFGADDGTGGEPNSISAPATAKNVITVGALESFRNLTNGFESAVQQGSETVTNLVKPFQTETDSTNQVASFSGRGNVGIGLEGENGRWKPDVVAPGSYILSARSSLWRDNQAFEDSDLQEFEFQTVPERNQNNYSMFIPPNAKSFEIQVSPNVQTVEPMPDLEIRVAYGREPVPEDSLGVNSVSLPDDGELGFGDLRFSVGNPSNLEVNFDLTTTLVVTNADADFFDTKKELNDQVGPYYRYESGSSMAAPAVSGMLALMQERFEEEEESYTPALMKALLINGAQSVNSIYDFAADKRLNPQGWGMPHLSKVLPERLQAAGDEVESPMQYVDQTVENALATGESKSWNLKLTEEFARNSGLRVTLVWTDPPANPAAGIKLVNDLDLVVSNTVSGSVWHGNDIALDSDFNSLTQTNLEPRLDNVNNVENVFVAGGLGTNDYVVSVIGRRVNVNAVTAHPEAIAQDYALVVSIGNLSLTNAFTLTESETGIEMVERAPINLVTNGVPLLNQRAGANSPLLGRDDVPNEGTINQWKFYSFTNFFDTNQFSTNAQMSSLSGLTNGSNVAFITFVPPNLSRARNLEADIDLYVSRDPGLTNLNATALANALTSTAPGGTEVIALTNAPVGEDIVYYIGVKAEDQQAAEFGFVTLSSDEPFETTDGNGNRVLRGLPPNVFIPDGSPDTPGGAFVFAVGISPDIVNRARVSSQILHDNVGDLVGNISHQGSFAVLNNHYAGLGLGETNHVFFYDDTNSGDFIGFEQSDSPGRLTDFIGTASSGLWMLSMVDNSLNHSGFVADFEVIVEPALNLNGDEGIDATVQPNRFRLFTQDVPPDGSLMETILSQTTGPLELYIRRSTAPTVDTFDKSGAFDPPGGSVTISTNDVPPLQAGKYFIGVFNPTAVPVDFNIRVRLENNLGDDFQDGLVVDDPQGLLDDALGTSAIRVDDARPVTDLDVGLRVNHPRLSDLSFRLISPTGTEVLLHENRGGTVATQLGSESLSTNFHHVALSYNQQNNRASLYLDGEVLLSRNLGNLPLNAAGDIYIGYDPREDQERQFLGSIDEVGLYNRAISEAELESIVRFGAEGRSDNGLIGLWHLNGTGDPAVGEVSLTISNGTFVAGRNEEALNLEDEQFASSIGFTNQNFPSLGFGAAGFTVDAWINPSDLSEERPIFYWGGVTNGEASFIEFLIEPGPSTNEVGVLAGRFSRLNFGGGFGGGFNPRNPEAVQVPAAPPAATISALEPGLIRTNGFVSNLVYTVFTSNTNNSPDLIKQTTVPYFTEGQVFNAFLGGFERDQVSGIGTFQTDEVLDQEWIVAENPLLPPFTNSVRVMRQLDFADSGSQFLSLGEGRIERDLETEPGQLYELRFAQRRQPAPEGIIGWWPGDGHPADIVGGNHGTLFGKSGYIRSVVGEGFFFTETNSYVRIPHADSLSLSNEFTFEAWVTLFRTGSPEVQNPVSGAGGDGLFGKTSDDNTQVNYAANLAPGFGAWFDDPNIAGEVTDDPQQTIESVRSGARGFSDQANHYAATFRRLAEDLVEIETFVNGESAEVKAVVGSLADAVNEGFLTLGATSVDGPYLNGIIDEPTLYDRAISAEEINEIYQSRSLGKCLPPCDPRINIIFGGISTNAFSSGVEWEQKRVRFIAAEETTRLSVEALGNGVYLDSFELVPVFLREYQPEEAMKPLIGESGLGEWRLEVIDSRVGPVETLISPDLISWNLNLTFAPTNFPAITLTNGIPFTGLLSEGATEYFIVNVPRTAEFSTNAIASLNPLTLSYNEEGLPRGGISDYRILTLQTNAAAVISETNGTFRIDGLGNVIPDPNAAASASLKAGERYYLGLHNPGESTEYLIQVNFDSLDTNIFGLTPLESGITITTNISASSTLQYYRFTASPNASQVRFEAMPVDGDIDLFVRKATLVPDPLPTPAVFDFSSEMIGIEDELISFGLNDFPALEAGDWYVGVLNVSDEPVEFDIRATEFLTVRTNLTRLENRVPLGIEQLPSGELTELFQFTIDDSANRALVELYDLTEDVDLYIQFGQEPTLDFAAITSVQSGLVSERVIIDRDDFGLLTLNGDWFIGVANAGTTTANYQIQASTPNQDGMLVAGDPIRVTMTIGEAGRIDLSWPSVPGEGYRVELSPDLVNWVAVPGGSLATEDSFSLSFSMEAPQNATQVFYRVIQVPRDQVP